MKLRDTQYDIPYVLPAEVTKGSLTLYLLENFDLIKFAGSTDSQLGLLVKTRNNIPNVRNKIRIAQF